MLFPRIVFVLNIVNYLKQFLQKIMFDINLVIFPPVNGFLCHVCIATKMLHMLCTSCFSKTITCFCILALKAVDTIGSYSTLLLA